MTPEALAFLAALGCHPTADLVQEPQMAALGYFEAGTIYMQDPTNTQVFMHEAVHACQYQAAGPARDGAEHARREREARRVEQAWKERDK